MVQPSRAIRISRCAVICGLRLYFAFLALTVSAVPPANSAAPGGFSFITAGDMRNYLGPLAGGKRQFDGLCDAVKGVGQGEFMISPGDCDPPSAVRATIDQHLGTNYLWYPVVGNHDIEAATNIAWLRGWASNGIPHLVQHGPKGAELTIYSFDFGNSHFIALNDYYDGRSDAIGRGDVPEAALDWLAKDLASTHQPVIWVIGHKPIQSMPDMDSGRLRHSDDSVSASGTQRERFVQLLRQFRVRAYICGHTHNCSIARIEGVWQTDSGHARGAGDIGSPSTFLRFRVSDENAWVDVFRSDTNGVEYKLRETVELK